MFTSDSFSKLNLIGVVSLFGGEVALSALGYIALLKNVPLSLYFAMVLSPGLQTVSLKMFKQMEDELSRAISGGGARSDGKEIMGLALNANYKYIGLHSGTNMTVASILGDTLIRKCKSEVGVLEIPSTRKNPQNRNLNLKVIKLGKMSGEKGSKYNFHVHVDHDPRSYQNVLLYTMPLLTIMGMIFLLVSQNWVFYLALSNIISNMSIAFVARGNGLEV